MTWRLVKLNVGLVLFAVAVAVAVAVGVWLGLGLGLEAELGIGPWDVLSGGLSQQLGTRFGLTAIGVSVAVLLISLAARVQPDVGTLLNVAVIGVVPDVLLQSPLLGGPVGVGTVLFALGIGPAVHIAFRVLRQTPVRRPVEARA